MTGDIDLAANTYFFTYTPAGNAGSVVAAENLAVNPATHNQIYLFGDATDPTVALRVPDRRSVETTTKFFFLHTAENHPLVDFYLLDAGSVLEDEAPFFRNVSPGLATPVINPTPGDKEMYLTVAGETTIIAGPVALTIALGDVIEYLSFDNVDPATADLVEIPLP